MKLSVKCFKHLTNKGNGQKCKLAPLVKSRHRDCVFKTNGMIESSAAEMKIIYIYSLMKKCKEWHEDRKQNKHYTEDIQPQMEKICSDIKRNEQNKC